MTQKTKDTLQRPTFSISSRRRRMHVTSETFSNNYQPSKEGIDGMDYNEINLDDDDVKTPEKTAKKK